MTAAAAARAELRAAGVSSLRTAAAPPAIDLLLVKPGELDWQDRALCAEVDSALFFPEKGETGTAAKRICRSCEVRAECLAFAVDNGIAYGVWGGMDERERRSLGPQHLDFRPAGRHERNISELAA